MQILIIQEYTHTAHSETQADLQDRSTTVTNRSTFYIQNHQRAPWKTAQEDLTFEGMIESCTKQSQSHIIKKMKLSKKTAPFPQ